MAGGSVHTVAWRAAPHTGDAAQTPAAKTRPPRELRPEVRRAQLLRDDRLRRSPILLVTAPAGYGKTTFARQWARSIGFVVAWASLDATDADPAVLIRTVQDAVGAALGHPVGSPDPITADEPAFSRRVLPEFRRTLEQIDQPITLVIDELHVVPSVSQPLVLEAVPASLPEGSRVAFVSRTEPGLPTSRWQGQGLLTRVGRDRLAFDLAEARTLVAAVGQTADADGVRDLLSTTEGWPVAVYLQAVSGAEPADEDIHAFIADEVLAALDDELTDFLRRTSVLTTLDAETCDAVTGRADSHLVLRRARDASQLVRPTQGKPGCYRLHPLLRELLYADLADEPHLLHLQHERAAQWHDARGRVDHAVHHALASHTLGSAGPIILQASLPLIMRGSVSRVARWLEHLDEHELASSPELCVASAYVALQLGDAAATLRWAEQAAVALGPGWDTRLDHSEVGPALSLLTVMGGGNGFGDAATVAHSAARALPTGHILRPFAFLVAGWLQTLAGDVAGLSLVEEAHDLASALRLPGPSINALSLLALSGLLGDDWEAARSSAAAAYRLWDGNDFRDGTVATALMASVNGLIAARTRQPERARQFLALAGARSPMVWARLPWMQVIHEGLRAWTEVLLGSPGAAAAALGRAHGSLVHSPHSPFLDAFVGRCSDTVRTASPLARLSRAEREIFRHLDSQYTLSEIGAQLHVSHATVKTQVASIYRKLGVNSRREAVAVAAGHGDGSPSRLL